MTTTADTLHVRQVSAPDDDARLTIAEMAERTGVGPHTLRYYERIGLLRIGRDHAGHRSYTAADFSRVVFLSRMRATGMSIRDLQRYTALVDAGEHTVGQRLAIMQAHRAAMVERMAELQLALAVVDHKISGYGGACGP